MKSTVYFLHLFNTRNYSVVFKIPLHISNVVQIPIRMTVILVYYLWEWFRLPVKITFNLKSCHTSCHLNHVIVITMHLEVFFTESAELCYGFASLTGCYNFANIVVL